MVPLLLSSMSISSPNKISPALQLPGDSPQQIPVQKVHPVLYKHMYKSVQYYRPFSLSLFLSLMNMLKRFRIFVRYQWAIFVNKLTFMNTTTGGDSRGRHPVEYQSCIYVLVTWRLRTESLGFFKMGTFQLFELIKKVFKWKYFF